MPTADELLSPDDVRRLAALLRRTSPEVRAASAAAPWQHTADRADVLAPLALGARARTVADALLDDTGHDYAVLAAAIRRALDSDNDGDGDSDSDSDHDGDHDGDDADRLTGWMIWPVTEAVATAATGSPTDAHFDDGLDLLARLTPRLTGEFALRTFLNADLDRTLTAARSWTGSPDPAVRRLASEGTRPKLPWARQVPALNRAPATTVPLLDALRADDSPDVRRSVANHLNDLSRLDPALATATAARWARRPAPTTDAVVRHALRTLVKDGDPAALELVGFHGGPRDLAVTGPRLAADAVPIGGTLAFTARVANTSDAPVSLSIDYVVHHRKANGRQTPKVFKLAKRTLAPGEAADLTRSHSFRVITTRVYHPGPHALELQINGHRYGHTPFTLHPQSD